ncbi:MAG: helix-turn-helix transcriptional regulator [Planctomycetota bacterium]|nr:helix-turn-helix transcriptional regulator [Planctomycetota bacterium]
MLPNNSPSMLSAQFVNDTLDRAAGVVFRHRRQSSFGIQVKNTSTSQSVFTIKDLAPDLVFFNSEVPRAAVRALSRRFSSDYDVVSGMAVLDQHSESKIPLTPRQIEVLQIYGCGNTTIQTATILGITYKAVDSHLNRIRKALGIRDKARLALYCVACGLIRIDQIPSLAELQVDGCVTTRDADSPN